MKRSLIFTALVPICMACAAEELKLMSYNIHHCAGADKLVDIPRVAAVITNERPYFVGLQELDRKTSRAGGLDEPAALARLTGLHATFAATIPVSGGEYGIAVLSREKPLSVFKAALPGREPRMLLLCEFTNCWFGTMHLALQSSNRVESVEIVRNAVAERATSKPVYLTGDWNSCPDSETLDGIRGFMTILSRTDSGTYNGFKPACKGVSRHCIDYIALDAAAAKGVSVRESHVVEDAVASDHFPILVTVDWR